MNILVLYQKSSCPLCDEVKSLIELLAMEYSIQLEEVDIEQREELTEKYLFEVPVIVVNGEEMDYRSIDYIKIRERLH